MGWDGVGGRGRPISALVYESVRVHIICAMEWMDTLNGWIPVTTRMTRKAIRNNMIHTSMGRHQEGTSQHYK